MKSGAGNHDLMNRIKTKIKRYLLSKVAYFSDNEIVPLIGSELAHVTAVIVKKSHFFETEKIYPISNKTHVIKALKLEATSLCPFEDADFFYDLKKTEQGYLVHLWFYKKNLLLKINNLLNNKITFLFPENFLIFKALATNEIAFINDGQYWVSNSSRLTSFKVSQGNLTLLNDKENKVSISTLEEKFTLFSRGIYKSLPLWLKFKLTSDKNKEQSCRYCQFIQSAFIATFIYLVGSTVLIKGMDVYFQNKVKTNKEYVANFIKIRNEYRTEQNIYNTLTVGFENNVSPSSIFSTLALTTTKYTLERINTRGNTVFVTATSEEPLAVLEDMINLDSIKNVSFANKVSDINVDNLKRFTITYQY